MTRNTLIALVGLTLATAVVSATVSSRSSVDSEQIEGRAPARPELAPSVEAAFADESYPPGATAELVISNRAPGVTVRVFRSGPELVATRHDREMQGVPLTGVMAVGTSPGRRTVAVRIGPWPSGLYYARLRAADGRVGFAPFVVRPARIGHHRVAVVLPTLTWQAYNFRDEDGDGVGDSWYVDRTRTSVRLGRAHLSRGVPYGLRYHLGFLHWLHRTGRAVDYLSQRDLERVASARALARAYDLVVFAGHHEYVTRREYDLVEGYRDLGGNLMFLSANNFFYEVVRRGDVIERTTRWRDVGRPEAGLVGVQYVAYQRSPRRAWVVRRSPASRWIFAGTGLVAGAPFGRGGVEIDQVTSASPRGVQVVAEIPNLFGPGLTAQMTYYTTSSGAKVFASGAFHLTRSVTSDRVVARVLSNLWARMAQY